MQEIRLLVESMISYKIIINFFAIPYMYWVVVLNIRHYSSFIELSGLFVKKDDIH